MADTPFPLPRSIRQTEVLLGTGATRYGPFGTGWGIFDIEDVLVETRPAAGGEFVAAAVTIEKVAVSNRYSTFYVTFATAITAATAYRVKGKRKSNRQVAVTRGGVIDGLALEEELSKQTSVLQEHERDIDALTPAGPKATSITGYDSNGNLTSYPLSQLLLGSFDARGPFAGRAAYNAQAASFTYLDTDSRPLQFYMRDTAVAGVWVGPFTFGLAPSIIKAVPYTPWDVSSSVGSGADDTATLLTFLANVGTGNYKKVNWGGNFKTSASLELNGDPALNTRREDIIIHGDMRLNATAAMPYMMRMKNMSFATIDALTMIGNGSFDYATKGVGHGLQMESTTFITMRKVRAELMRGYGVFDNSIGAVNDENQFGQVHALHCGSGRALSEAASRSLDVIISNRVDTGSTLDQLSTFNVTGLPGTEHDFSPARAVPMYANLSADPTATYMVVGYNRGGGTVSLFPKPPAAVVGGTLRYYFGGAVLNSGQDSNLNQYGLINAVSCGIGINEAQLYGSKIGVIQASNCAVGLSLGASQQAAYKGFAIDLMYCEGNNIVDIAKASISRPPSQNGYVNLMVTGDTALAKVKAFGSYRVGVTLYDTYSYFDGIDFTLNGRHLPYLGGGKNIDDTNAQYAGTIVLDANKPAPVRQILSDVPIIDILPASPNINLLWGIADMEVICVGTSGAANYAPTTVTFRPPAGWNLNGAGVNVVFSKLSGPTNFFLKFDYLAGTPNIIIQPSRPNADLGWAAMSGTATKAALATYALSAASAGYVQAESTGMMLAIKAISERMKAMDDWLRANGLLKT